MARKGIYWQKKVTRVIIFIENEGFGRFPGKHFCLWSFFKMYVRRRPPVGHTLAFGDPENAGNLKVQKIKKIRKITSNHRLINNQCLIKY